MTDNRSVLVTVIGRGLGDIDFAGLAHGNELRLVHTAEIGPELPTIIDQAPRDERALYVGTGNYFYDLKIAAALGVPVVLVFDTPGAHVDLALNEAKKLGAVVAEACDHERLAWAMGPALEVEAEVYMSPSVFGHQLVTQARATGSHIVLPEGEDDRILEAAAQVLNDGIAKITILGDKEDIARRAEELQLDLSQAEVINHLESDLFEGFAKDFAELRKKKGITLDDARKQMKDVSYFATMMVHKGLADGMVSGAVNTTAATLRPAFQIIKTVPEASVVSSIFLMVMRGRLWAFGDCAVNPNPTPAQLGEIAVVSARTAAAFGIDPKVAMLSYSTGASGAGPDVEKVIEGLETARKLDPELAVDGPLQFDAACEPSVAAKKMPESDVAGQATVYIFPDLDAGNIGYKTAQRTGSALAVGPILQGLNKPVNDLSRGATVADIVNTVAVTAIQAAGGNN